MPYELQQNRYDQLIRRVGGVIGPGAKVAEVLPELFPVIDVERVPGELLALGATFLAWGSEDITAAAAELPKVQLFNPVASGKLVTCSSAILSVSSNGTVRWNIEAVPLTTASLNIRFRDSRFTGTERPVAQVRERSDPAATTAVGRVRLTGNLPFFLEPQNPVAVLSPGFGLTFQGETAQSFLAVTFFWRERVALESELLF